MNQKPKLSRIIATDYVSLLGVLLPVVGIALWIANAFFGIPRTWRGRPIPQGDPMFLWIALGAVVLGLLILIPRLRRFQSLFASGQRVAGRIRSVEFFKDRGRVEYEFQYAGQSRTGGQAIHKTRRTTAMRQGMPVTILVDPTNPQKSLLLDLYL